MPYKHGIYGEREAYSGRSMTKASGTIPAYVGTAPIHQLNADNKAEFDYSAYINKPILINSYNDAKSKIGISEDFKAFTLMEAVHAHFMNKDKPIAPIIVINMANPDITAEEKTAEVILTGTTGNKTGYIYDSAAKLETVSVEGMTQGDDYTSAYSDGKIKITVLSDSFTGGSVNAAYSTVDTSEAAVTTEVFKEALSALDFCEAITGEIPNLLVSPYWSKKKQYHDLMVQKAVSKIADKWSIAVVSDIAADKSTADIDAAVKKKAEDGFDSYLEKVCYPMVKYDDKIYHLSVMCAVRMQQTDTEADGVPYISPSNKAIYADACVLEDGTEIYFNEQTANNANANGLTTVNIVRGVLRLWGSSNANYNYATEENIDPEYKQDTSIRMTLYLMNKLQYDYIDSIDGVMSKRDVDSILASVQQWLNSLINEGKLLYGTVEFIEDENSLADMASGDFVFNNKYTTAPNAKSITFKTQYTDDGLKLLWGGNE